jgi:hypothetical protein
MFNSEVLKNWQKISLFPDVDGTVVNMEGLSGATRTII